MPIPTRDNYTFLGWFTGDTVNDGQFTTVTPVTKDVTLTARWKAVAKYRVTFDTAGGDHMDAVEYYADEQIEKLPDPTKTDYDFAGWYRDQYYSDPVQYPLQLSGDIVVYALWKEAEYTITFHTNVVITPDPVKAKGGTEYQSFTVPEVENYTFIDWYLNETYTQKVEFPFVLHANVDIYGKWEYDDPYKDYTKIKDIMQLQNITDMNGKYVLTDDIDCKNAELRTFGSESNPFKGEFIGDGHTISNFSIYADAAVNYYGLFAVNEGTIASVKFENATLNVSNENKAARYIGLVCAKNKGTVKQVYCNGQIVFSNNTTETSHAYLGGITGANEGNIENCMTCGNVTFKVNPWLLTSFHPNTKIGGICGTNSEKISKCLSSLSLRDSTQYGYEEVYFCGISGENSGTAEYCLWGHFPLRQLKPLTP